MPAVALKPLTVDASVFVRAFLQTEPGFEECTRFFAVLGERNQPLILPTLLKPEVAGALARGLRDLSAARAVLERLDGLAGTVFVGLDEGLAKETADLALKTGIRGADAVYACTARRFDATLVTLDVQQGERLPADIAVCSPAEFLEGCGE